MNSRVKWWVKWTGLLLFEILAVIMGLFIHRWGQPYILHEVCWWCIVVWISMTLITQKLNFTFFSRNRDAIATIVFVNVFSCFLIWGAFCFLSDKVWIYRQKAIVAVATLTFVESLFVCALRTFFRSDVPYYKEEEELKRYHSRTLPLDPDKPWGEVHSQLLRFRLILQQDPLYEDTQAWCVAHAGDLDDTVFMAALEGDEQVPVLPYDCRIIINVSAMNTIASLNRFLRGVNQALPMGGAFLCSYITAEDRKKYVYKSFPWGIKHIVYFMDFVIQRACSRLLLVRDIYFFFTKGKRLVLPKAEVLGRLYANGFVIHDEHSIQDREWVLAIKDSQPGKEPDARYSVLIKLKRRGLGGKEIGVYKFRTMHAYSEYLQPYMVEKYSLEQGGKIANDFRITTVGRFLRRTWLDEIPMFINLLQGDMKLIGVRPLSHQYFSMYTPEMQAMRIKAKPGLLPPYYAVYPKPKTLEEIQANEKKYLEDYFLHGWRTDWRYFWKIVKNILFKGLRSA